METRRRAVDAFVADLDAHARRSAVPFPGGEVAWRRFGDGPHVVLLHGGHGCWLHWARNILPLARRFTLWVPDMPGYGDSSRPTAPTMTALVDATRSTLDALVGPATPVTLVGFSFGALVAAELACGRANVSSLVLLGPAGHGGRRRPRGELRSWRGLDEPESASALREVMLDNLRMQMLFEPGSADELALAIHTGACLRTRFRSREISRAGGLPRCLDQLAVPVRMLWGEHDATTTPEEVAARLVSGHANRHAVVLAGAGHWVQYEAAERVNALLLEWLGAGADGGDPGSRLDGR